MANKGIDVSSYQPKDLAFFRTKKSQGAKFGVIKLTEGLKYLSPSAGSQISNSLKVFGQASVYHFFHGSGLAEARYFLYHVKQMGLDKSTVLAIDVEATDLPWNTTSQVNVFLKYLISMGYKHVITYGSGSWFSSGRINRSQLVDKHIWVAAYGVSQPGIANANAWQYTDNFHGVDCSYDFDGSLSGIKYSVKTSNAKSSSKTPSKQYYWSDNGLYEVISKGPVNVYGTLKFEDSHKRRSEFSSGSRFYAKAVKYGSIYRLMLSKDNYVTANKDYVKLIRKSGSK